MARVLELNSLDALEAYRFVWHRLWEETRRAAQEALGKFGRA